jgi:hypothetical protein
VVANDHRPESLDTLVALDLEAWLDSGAVPDGSTRSERAGRPFSAWSIIFSRPLTRRSARRVNPLILTKWA